MSRFQWLLAATFLLVLGVTTALAQQVLTPDQQKVCLQKLCGGLSGDAAKHCMENRMKKGDLPCVFIETAGPMARPVAPPPDDWASRIARIGQPDPLRSDECCNGLALGLGGSSYIIGPPVMMHGD